VISRLGRGVKLQREEVRINYGNGDRKKKTRLCRSQISLSDVVRNLTKAGSLWSVSARKNYVHKGTLFCGKKS
jgi:hypothetical protein